LCDGRWWKRDKSGCLIKYPGDQSPLVPEDWTLLSTTAPNKCGADHESTPHFYCWRLGPWG
ncbi:MAG TPA: hypothetical protein PK691_00575, partial [Thermomicrobiales bacterium]|nr:hypothetical protein [Thermomicrobiales bacterium]